MKPIKVALGYPWYAGAHRDCVTNFLTIQHYLGRLHERLSWLARDPIEAPYALQTLPPLDPTNPQAEVPTELIGTEFEFGIADEVGCSLVGLARESIVDKSLEWGADYILWSDSDMAWSTDAFLRLYLDQKPIVGALAFTGRPPIQPVIYSFEDYNVTENAKGQKLLSFRSEVVHDYKRDALQPVDAIGSGVMLIKAEVFREVPKPWFTSYGLGEDIHFCARAKAYGVQTWVDTRVKTAHVPTFHEKWHDERAYEAQQATANAVAVTA